MTSLKTSIKTITYLSDIGCLEIQGASLQIFIDVFRLIITKKRQYLSTKKADPGQSGSAFPVLMIYAISDSGCLMLPGINVRRNIPLAAHIQIIRPPLHHGLSGLQMLCFMHICRPHAVALLVAHLPLHRIA